MPKGQYKRSPEQIAKLKARMSRIGKAKKKEKVKETPAEEKPEEEKAAGRIKGPREPYAVATEAVKPGGAKRMAKKAVRTKGPAGLKRAARKAVATKGPRGLARAAKKAARTRKRRRRSRRIIGSAYKFAGNPNARSERIRQKAIAGGAPAGFVPFDQREPRTGRIRTGGMKGLIRQKIKEL